MAAAFARVRARLLSAPHAAPAVVAMKMPQAAETIRAAIWTALAELSETTPADLLAPEAIQERAQRVSAPTPWRDPVRD